MKIFETHAHYDDERFDEDRDELISSMLSDTGAVSYTHLIMYLSIIRM